MADASDLQKRLRAIRRSDEERARSASPESSNESIPPHEFIARLGRGPLSYTDAREFADRASDDELWEAAEKFLIVDDRTSLRALERVFRKRRWPLPVESLFEHSDDEARGWSVYRILGRIDDPKLRRFGLRLLRRTPLPRNAMETLKSSFRAGDEAAIWAVLPAIESYKPDHRHNALGDLLDLIRSYPDVLWQPFAEWVYEHTPCSFCRSRTVEWMVERGTLPDRVREEGVFDAEEDTRRAVLDLSIAIGIVL